MNKSKKVKEIKHGLTKEVLFGLTLMGHNRTSHGNWSSVKPLYFELECVKIVLKKFRMQGPKIRQKFQSTVEIAFREGNSYTPLHPFITNYGKIILQITSKIYF